MTNIDESSLVIFCPAWGQKYLDYLRRYALPSVMQPGNLPACGYEQITVLASTVGDKSLLENILVQGFDPLPAAIHVKAYPESPHHALAQLEHLRHVIRNCIESRRRMLLMMPDTIIANGGIFNMRQYARGKPVSVAAPHLRVTENPEQPVPISSKELVNWAMAHPHQSLTDSFCDKDHGTLTGAISLTRITPQMTTIIHYVPTVYLAWFTESDAAFFGRAPLFCEYDRSWDKHLESEGRLRVFGSSELFFAVELTDPDKNRIVVVPGSKLEEHSEFGCKNLKPFVGVLHG
jgi:hypothetical protein